MLRKLSDLTRLLLLALLLTSACIGCKSAPDPTEPPDTGGPADTADPPDTDGSALDEPVSCDAAATEYADLAALQAQPRGEDTLNRRVQYVL